MRALLIHIHSWWSRRAKNCKVCGGLSNQVMWEHMSSPSTNQAWMKNNLNFYQCCGCWRLTEGAVIFLRHAVGWPGSFQRWSAGCRPLVPHTHLGCWCCAGPSEGCWWGGEWVRAEDEGTDTLRGNLDGGQTQISDWLWIVQIFFWGASTQTWHVQHKYLQNTVNSA